MSAILSMALHLMTFLLMVTSSAVTSAKRREVSHLEFYMVLEEELAPQVKVLADRVLGILTSQVPFLLSCAWLLACLLVWFCLADCLVDWFLVWLEEKQKKL